MLPFILVGSIARVMGAPQHFGIFQEQFAKLRLFVVSIAGQ
jgi:hypothetical protein